MKVIVAGAPKTGTTSVCLALRHLGYTVYDSDEQLEVQLDLWHQILVRGDPPGMHLSRMFGDVDAVTDGPAYYFWEQLLQDFPSAKVILMTRDEDAWADSYKHQKELEWRHRWLARFSPRLHRLFEVVDAVERLSMGSEMFVGYMYKWKFRLHNDRVRAVVPKDQLLEFSVKDGWGPLCEFLDVEQPQEEFPHANRAASDYEVEFRKLRNEIMGGVALKTAVISAVLGFGVWLSHRWGRSNV
eukprot:GFKZ01011133.1.p1 GENE.GFKZ01011133.1~~GFKZ01011133.1.p1  ORF type:complete len:242 (-),score=30.01 GFKZ01011133.1:511-1236(-)